MRKSIPFLATTLLLTACGAAPAVENTRSALWRSTARRSSATSS